MTTHAAETTVRSSAEVGAPIDRAFRVFTHEIGTWWDPTHHILAGELAEMVFEPFVGGYVYDRGVDGSECRWARVLAYEPPRRLVISWDISPRWQIESDLEHTSEVEVRFVPEGETHTRVQLEHRNLDRHGDRWRMLHDGIAGDEGWALYLRRFAGLFGTIS
jgi:uncharacterized protein YndB with AHSA1/START domain